MSRSQELATGRRRAIGLGVGAVSAALLMLVGSPMTQAGGAEAAVGNQAVAPLADTPEGFGAGTTGGGNASPVTVGSLADFTSAVAGDQPKVVRLDGHFTVDGTIAIGSNTTVLGVGSGSGLTGGGLVIHDVENVIVRNLNLSKPLAPTDSISVQRASHVWIDHNTLSADQDHSKDYYDGLLDITHAGDNVTVSWNRFENHFKGSLVGHSDNNGGEDTGYLKVTYHHNHFNNVYSRMPSLRFGTGHVYNNLIESGDTAVHSRMGARMLVENNVFRDTKLAITTERSSSVDGFVVERGNDFGGAATEISQVGDFTSAPYPYQLDATGSVASLVTNGAGAGRM